MGMMRSCAAPKIEMMADSMSEDSMDFDSMDLCAGPQMMNKMAPPPPGCPPPSPSAVMQQNQQNLPQRQINKPLSNKYQTITNAQDPSGFWSSIAPIDLEPENGKLILGKLVDEQVSATLYALVLLLSKFGSQYNEWKLTAIKGVSFLKSKFGENAVDKFNEVASEVGVSVDDDLVDELFE